MNCAIQTLPEVAGFFREAARIIEEHGIEGIEKQGKRGPFLDIELETKKDGIQLRWHIELGFTQEHFAASCYVGLVYPSELMEGDYFADPTFLVWFRPLENKLTVHHDFTAFDEEDRAAKRQDFHGDSHPGLDALAKHFDCYCKERVVSPDEAFEIIKGMAEYFAKYQPAASPA